MNLSEPLIGLGGPLRAGKDAAADRLVEAHGYVKIGFSDALLDHAKRLDPYILVDTAEAAHLQIDSGFYRFNDLLDAHGYIEAKTIKDFREFMQKDGTEGGRNFFGENVWVNIVAKMIDDHRGAGHPVVVTGVRYPNELQMIRELSGWPVWISRPGLESTSTHTSETSVTVADFEVEMVNGGTLEDLYTNVDNFATTLHLF